MLLTRGPMDVGKPPAFNEEHASPLIQILAWLFLSFSISAVVAQFATKTAMSKRLIGADYVLLAALNWSIIQHHFSSTIQQSVTHFYIHPSFHFHNNNSHLFTTINMHFSTALTATALFVAASGAAISVDGSVKLPKIPSIPKIPKVGVNVGKRGSASVYLDASVDLPTLPSLASLNLGKRDPASVYLDASVDLPKLPSLPKINIGKRDPASVYLDAS
ncbi:hypothetical protein PtrEW4_010677, partial [Pyrenophora tritici-repentis]